MCVGDDVDANKEDDDDANEEDEDDEVAAKEEEEDGDVDDDAKEEEDYKEECFQRDRAAAISARRLRRWENTTKHTIVQCAMQRNTNYKYNPLEDCAALRKYKTTFQMNLCQNEKLDSMSHAEAASDLS